MLLVLVLLHRWWRELTIRHRPLNSSIIALGTQFSEWVLEGRHLGALLLYAHFSFAPLLVQRVFIEYFIVGAVYLQHAICRVRLVISTVLQFHVERDAA